MTRSVQHHEQARNAATAILDALTAIHNTEVWPETGGQ